MATDRERAGGPRARVWLLLAFFSHACFCMPLDEIMSVHPDGTPVHPAELKMMLARNALEDRPLDVLRDPEVHAAVMGDSLETFVDVMQRHNYRHIFHEDGSVRDIARWRQNVREDAYYADLLMQSAPGAHAIITDPTVSDSEVQDRLRQQDWQSSNQKSEL